MSQATTTVDPTAAGFLARRRQQQQREHDAAEAFICEMMELMANGAVPDPAQEARLNAAMNMVGIDDAELNRGIADFKAQVADETAAASIDALESKRVEMCTARTSNQKTRRQKLEALEEEAMKEDSAIQAQGQLVEKARDSRQRAWARPKNHRWLGTRFVGKLAIIAVRLEDPNFWFDRETQHLRNVYDEHERARQAKPFMVERDRRRAQAETQRAEIKALQASRKIEHVFEIEIGTNYPNIIASDFVFVRLPSQDKQEFDRLISQCGGRPITMSAGANIDEHNRKVAASTASAQLNGTMPNVAPDGRIVGDNISYKA